MRKCHSGTSNRAGPGTVVHNRVIVILETECESSVLSPILAFTCQDKIIVRPSFIHNIFATATALKLQLNKQIDV